MSRAKPSGGNSPLTYIFPICGVILLAVFVSTILIWVGTVGELEIKWLGISGRWTGAAAVFALVMTLLLCVVVPDWIKSAAGGKSTKE